MAAHLTPSAQGGGWADTECGARGGGVRGGSGEAGSGLGVRAGMGRNWGLCACPSGPGGVRGRAAGGSRHAPSPCPVPSASASASASAAPPQPRLLLAPPSGRIPHPTRRRGERQMDRRGPVASAVEHWPNLVLNPHQTLTLGSTPAPPCPRCRRTCTAAAPGGRHRIQAHTQHPACGRGEVGWGGGGGGVLR